MIQRVLIDNYRCFTAFDWKPGRLALLLGENGSGKSSLTEALWGLVGLLSTRYQLRKLFPPTTLTRWDKRHHQSFGFDLALSEGVFEYRLVIAHDPKGKQKARVEEERLSLGDRLLFHYGQGQVHIVHDDGTAAEPIPVDPWRSPLGAISAGPNDAALGAFKRWVRDDVWLLKPDPRAMSASTDEDSDGLEVDMSNLASWYREWVPTAPQAMLRLMKALEPVLPGFQALHEAPSSSTLQVAFAPQGQPAYEADFDELSDGQRQLVGLYLLRHALVLPGRLLILDEPDNYVALREIQPWLREMTESALARQGIQLWLISHHPEALNQLAREYGYQFVRPNGGPVQVDRFPDPTPLTPAELAAGGWDHE